MLAVGGGKDVPEILDRFVALAGGTGARIVLLPVSSAREDRGQGLRRLFESRGASSIAVWAPATPGEAGTPEALSVLREGDAFWFGGGDQKRALALLRGTAALDLLRERHAAGAPVGGSSAGCALLSRVMIEGGDATVIEPGAVPTGEGLGVLRDVVLDQHFLERGRLTRLINVVLDEPGRTGLGVDRETGVLITGRRVEVLGRGQAVLVEAVRRGALRSVEGRALHGSAEIRLRLYASGETFELPEEN